MIGNRCQRFQLDLSTPVEEIRAHQITLRKFGRLLRETRPMDEKVNEWIPKHRSTNGVARRRGEIVTPHPNSSTANTPEYSPTCAGSQEMMPTPPT
jgi:hypothetical protein